MNPKEYMTFVACHDAVRLALADVGVTGAWNISVEAWDEGRISWKAWVAVWKEHFLSPTPEELVASIRNRTVRGAMTIESVRVS